MIASGRGARVLAPLAIAGGAITELVVLDEIGGQLSWAVPLVIAVAGLSALALMTSLSPRTRKILVGVALAALMAAPVTWAAETIGHATNGTFPTGGPPAGFARGGPRAGFARGGAGRGFGGGGPGGFGADSATLNAVVRYTDAHGGGTIGVESQSSAATEILSANANIAGLGGFSGRESTVSATWIAQQVESGHLRWIVTESSGGGAPGDTRTGSKAALSIVAQACSAVSVTANGTKVKLYDCLGRGSAILRAAQASSAAADK